MLKYTRTNTIHNQTHTYMQICKCTHIACTNTYTHTRIHPARYHTHTLSHTRTTTHTHDVALSPSLTLSWTHTHRTHSIQGFLNWFFKSFLQCWSCHWEDRSIIQEQYLLRVWRRQASRGLWLNLRYDINAPRHQGRSSYQDHAHQESHVFRFKVVQYSSLCSTPLITPSLCITPHHIIFTNAFIRQIFYPYWNAISNDLLNLTCQFQRFSVSIRLLPDMWLSWCFGQHVLRKWHYYPWVFWTCVQFVFVPCCNICVMVYACYVFSGEI